MENTQLKILSEIKASLESLKSQIDVLEAKVDAVAVLLPDPEEDQAVAAPEIEEPVAVPEPVSEPEAAAEPELEPETEPEPEPEPEVEPQPEVEPEPEPVSEPIDLDISDMVVSEPSVPAKPEREEPVVAEPAAVIPEEMPIDISVDDLPEDLPVEFPVDLPAPDPDPSEAPMEEKKKVLELNDAESLKEKHAVLDRLTEKQSWRTDMPGSPVSNIISAISLNDRVLFINTLFGEDPMKFRNTIDTLNAMGSIGEAIGYVLDEFPQWNLDSDVVYRFMMAVRRKLR